MYRKDGEIIPVPKKDLPVALPSVKSLSGSGNALEKIENWDNLSSLEKNQIFESFFNYDGDVNNLIKYFDKKCCLS